MEASDILEGAAVFLAIAMFVSYVRVTNRVNNRRNMALNTSPPPPVKRKVSQITTTMLRDEIMEDNNFLSFLDEWDDALSSTEAEAEYYRNKHWNINVRLSIKQTK